MNQLKEALVPLLLTARAGGTLAAAIKQIRWGNPSPDGQFPDHTGGGFAGLALIEALESKLLVPHLEDTAIVSLLQARLAGPRFALQYLRPNGLTGRGRRLIRELLVRLSISADVLDRPSVDAQDSFDLTDGYAVATLLRGAEASINLALGEGFLNAQRLLDFSLTEWSKRGSGDVLATPRFQRLTTASADVFMVMPFSAELAPAYHDVVRPTVIRRGKSILRGDEIAGPNYIIDQIWSVLLGAECAIVDVTGQNANVMYELGICHTLGKPTLILTQDHASVPFDIKQWRYFVYHLSEAGRELLETAVTDFLGGLGSGDRLNNA